MLFLIEVGDNSHLDGRKGCRPDLNFQTLPLLATADLIVHDCHAGLVDYNQLGSLPAVVLVGSSALALDRCYMSGRRRRGYTHPCYGLPILSSFGRSAPPVSTTD